MREDRKPNGLLRHEREKKGWSQSKLAELIGADPTMVSRWETGERRPDHGYQERLCDLFKKDAVELGFIPKMDGAKPSNEEASCQKRDGSDSSCPVFLDASQKQILGVLLREDLTLALQEIVLTWPSNETEYHKLQVRIQQTIEDFCAMKHVSNPTLTRREALRRLAYLPVQLCSLSSLDAVFFRSCEEILTQCAAGIAACEELSNEGELTTSFVLLATYWPTLAAIVRDNAAHRQPAALLATQCLFAQTVLAVHLESYPQAFSYAQQAVTYSEVTGDLSLRITALGRLAWVYSSNNWRKTALEKALQMQALFQQNRTKLYPNVQSYVYGVLAKNQALNGQVEAAQQSLHLAHSAFFMNSPSHEHVKHDSANFLLDDGITHLFIAQPEAALHSLAKIIQPDDLTLHIPLTKRFYPEVVNHLTLTLLKIPQKDMEQIIFCWRTGLQGAQNLRSEQRFKESARLYELMEVAWPGEKRIAELRDHIVHWEE